MRICAVDLKNNEANLCLMELNQGLINVPDCRAKKLTLLDASSTEQIRNFKRQFIKLIEDYRIEADEIQQWEAKENYLLTLGNTQVVRVLLNGREIETNRINQLLTDWVVDANLLP